MVKQTVKLRYVQKIIHSRTGRTYYYFRRNGDRIAMNEPFGSAEFMQRYEELLAGTAPAEATIPGTLGHLIRLYKAETNDAWTQLRDATRKSYQRAFDVLAPFSMTKIEALTRPKILKIRDEAIKPTRGRWMANYVVTVLGLLFAFEHDRDSKFESPLKEKVRKVRAPRRKEGQAGQNRPWTDAERSSVLDAAPQHVRLALILAMCTGWRKADVFRATMSAIKDDEITIETSKTGFPVRAPLHPLLEQALAKRPKSDSVQIVLTKGGSAFTPDGFDTVWHRLKKRLEAEGKIEPGLTIHGLRHTLGTMLREAGVSDEDARRIIGHESPAMTEHYNKTAALPKKVKAAVIKLDIAGNGGRKGG